MHPTYAEKLMRYWEDKFWSKVEKRGENECWPWIGQLGTSGYGSYRAVGGNMRAASREAYELVHGPLPDGIVVCHSCDNRNCCNPRHLWIGTVADNNRDRALKGRTDGPKGATHPRATTTEEQVRSIRTMLSNGTPQVEIASRCGVSKMVVNQIATGRTWKHMK